jgi:hypothetical protein
MFTTNLDDLATAEAVIEAVTEDLAVKSALFARLDEAVPDACFLASNTSSIPIAELAAATTRPERVLGLHFFSPVPVMKLVEVVVALDTADDALESAQWLVGELGKQAIPTKDRSGFIAVPGRHSIKFGNGQPDVVELRGSVSGIGPTASQHPARLRRVNTTPDGPFGGCPPTGPLRTNNGPVSVRR